MFIELIDALRCIRPHEDSWLVAAARRTEARHVIEGVLGCPVCGAEYPVAKGVADFTAGSSPEQQPVSAPPRDARLHQAPDHELAFRAGGMLALDEVRGPVLLLGTWSALAPTLVEVVPVPYLVVNATTALPLRAELSELRVHRLLPLATGAVHAVALDDAAVAAGLLSDAVRVLRQRGRLVAPAAAPLPSDVRELARDDRYWVAERLPVAGAPLPLTRAARA